MFRHFPLFSIHPQAQPAADAAECAGEQGKFWEMHDALFESQEQWAGNEDADQIFNGLATDLGLDQDQFVACLAVRMYGDKVEADYQAGLAAGVSGTPAFLINGVSLSGAQPFEAFEGQIEYFLAGGEPPSLEVAADSFRSLGSPDAPVVVTEFSDFQ